MRRLIFLCASLCSVASYAANPCDVAAWVEKARYECAGGNAGSCFIYTTLIDNKDSWKKIEQTCLQECKGNLASCTKYQSLGEQLVISRCKVDPDACALQEQMRKRPGM